ncbi:MAG: hypothetical protein NXH70_02460 [Hyphomonas sp.]|nr:hypothetical protein [Hyphomonas sp.]
MKTTTIVGFRGTEDFGAIPGANTFRIGSRYDNALHMGSEVVLRDDDTGEIRGDDNNDIRGTAIVADIFTGSLRNMLQEHGEKNHHLTREDSEVRLRDLRSFLIDTYTDQGYSVDDTTPFTVIYFEAAEDDATGGATETTEESKSENKTEAGKAPAPTPTPKAAAKAPAKANA